MNDQGGCGDDVGWKFPPWLEGDGEGAIIDGFGGRNGAAIAVILIMISCVCA